MISKFIYKYNVKGWAEICHWFFGINSLMAAATAGELVWILYPIIVQIVFIKGREYLDRHY